MNPTVYHTALLKLDYSELNYSFLITVLQDSFKRDPEVKTQRIIP
jgi:hypothetical protein